MATITNKQQSKSIRVKELTSTKISLLYIGTLIASVTLSIVGLSALSLVVKLL
ncbi:MAG: hypothetical protein HeimC3_53860 [Candidatus Heimdallarchaeota archaeon LC_3]|nr:MAG: hypothetical protein HeimC3_53860 [Candidatus Heimdallarchaeota archaeon LC_3]